MAHAKSVEVSDGVEVRYQDDLLRKFPYSDADGDFCPSVQRGRAYVYTEAFNAGMLLVANAALTAAT